MLKKWLHTGCKTGVISAMLSVVMSVQAAPEATPVGASSSVPSSAERPASPKLTAAMSVDKSLAAQRQPSNKALSAANQTLISHNAQLQRQVNDLQMQVDVLIYERQGQLFLYGAFTVLISLLVGVFLSWLFVRRERW